MSGPLDGTMSEQFQEPEVNCPCRFGELSGPGGPKAVFLDRDGVLIPDTGYPDNPEAITLLATVGEALRALRQEGWRLVVVSNQSGVARGKFTLATLDAVHAKLQALLAAEGVVLDALYFCPHHAEAGLPPFDRTCDHRKPASGMLHSATMALDLDLAASWMIGDRESDVMAGKSAGCRTILLGAAPTTADLLAADLGEAARLILQHS